MTSRSLLPGIAMTLVSLLFGACATEQGSWDKAAASDSVEAYEQFRTAFPESPHVSAANARIEELDWTAAMKADSPEGFQRFVERHPQGARADQARERIGLLRKTALHRAAAAGRLADVRALLDAGGDVNSIDGAGVAPLHVAARECKMDSFSFLLERGAAIDRRARDDSTPLHWAARAGCVAAVDRLLAGGIDVNIEARDTASFIRVLDDGKAEFVDAGTPGIRGTALHWAANFGQAEAATLLIQKGAAVNRLTPFGLSPLHHAANSGSEAVVRVLLEKGARKQYAEARNGQPIHYARTAAVAKMLGEGALRTASEFRGRPMHNAAFLGHSEALAYFLDNSVPVDELGTWNMDNGWTGDVTALWTAAFAGQLDVVKQLESRGGSLRFAVSKGERGGTLLHAAAWGGHPQVITYLLSRGLPVDPRGNMPTSFPLTPAWEDVTPLGIAAHFGNVEAMQVLLSAGAGIDVASPGNWTPVALAIIGEKIDAVKLLLSRGATLDLTLEQINRRNTSDAIKALLRERLQSKQAK